YTTLFRSEAEVVDVGVEVGGDLRVVGEVGVVGGHRVVGVGHALARGVDVQRAVGGRQAVLVAEDPVAADPVALLEAVEGDAPLVQGLGGGDARRAGRSHRSNERCLCALRVKADARRASGGV